MPTIPEIVHSTLGSLWSDVLTAIVDDRLVAYAIPLIDCDIPAISSDFDRLDDPVLRLSILPPEGTLADLCLTRLLEKRPRFDQAISAANFSRVSRTRLSSELEPLIRTKLHSPTTGAVFASAPFPRVWKPISHRIAATIFSRLSNGGFAEEWQLFNRLLLCSLFGACRLTTARLARNALHGLSRSLLSVRGSCFRIPQRISESGVLDTPPDLPTQPVPVVLQSSSFSDLLGSTARECAEVVADNGIMHRILGTQTTTAIPNDLLHIVPHGIEQNRHRRFKEYEFTLLTHMSLGCIEQLLRSWAQHRHVPHMEADIPISTMEWLDNIPCTADLRGSLNQLYSTDGWNIRNRVMHGGLLELESKFDEGLFAIAYPHVPIPPVDTATDPYSCENTARLCLETLRMLDNEVETVALVPNDRSWTRAFELTTDELDFALHLHCDLRDGRDVALAWQNEMSHYYRAVLPGIKQLLVFGMLGWSRPYHPTDSLVHFAASVLCFEALYRQTAHLYGFRVLQSSRQFVEVEQRQVETRRFQYQMLDQRRTSLATDEVLAALTAYIGAVGQPHGIRTLRLAIKLRDAMAHGGVGEFTEEKQLGYGHLFIKAAQLLMESGEHHMASEGAYFLWENERHGAHGYDLEDWLRAEQATREEVFRVGALPPANG